MPEQEMPHEHVTTIAVLPSDAKDRWDVGVRRADGWSVTWFDSPVDDLPSRVTRALRSTAR